jgi:four helix bundle protein
MRDFKNLIVWQKAHILAVETYKITANFPKSEIYGLTSQVRRACISIPANIAEGCGRNTDADFSRFLQIAFGSASELEYYFIIAKELLILDSSICENLGNQVNEVKRMLSGLIEKTKKA